MNIVYKLTFLKRKQRNEKPFYYIGSKSNCYIENGTIYDKSGKKYFGSSCYKNYYEIVKKDDIFVEILKECDSYTYALNFESTIQKNLDVVADPKYFNLSIATENNFTDPNYATYKHNETGKCVRLRRDHPKVLSGEYVGVSKGMKIDENVLKNRKSKKGENNPFYGKTHTDETKKLLKNISTGKTHTDETKENMSKSQKNRNIVLSDEHKEKLLNSVKGHKVLKNKDTGETVHVKCDDTGYDPNIWVNPASLSKSSALGTKWITNGRTNIRILKDEQTPDGWRLGKIHKKPNKFKYSKWGNNGNEQRQFHKNEDLPEGWKLGMLKRVKKIEN